MSYLTEAEIATYCNIIEGVTLSDVEEATSLINGYLGRTYEPRQFTDRIRFVKKPRGKLTHAPVISIQSAKLIIRNPFGKDEKDIDIDDVELDPENDGYFTYIGNYGFDGLIWGRRALPSAIKITYTSGFETYPERLKIACAMLAQNIRQLQSYSGAKELQSLDYQIRMTDDSFFTSDIKRLLKGLDKDVRAL